MSTREETWSLLELPSDLIAEDPESFKQWLLAALTARRATTLNGRNVTRVGTAALQLLVAFRRECAVLGIPCELRECSAALSDTLTCLGLEQAVGLTR